MIDNIKKLWGLMLGKTQKEAVESIKNEFGLKSTIYVRQTWIWGGGVPEDSQKRVVEIFQKLLKKQNKKVEEEID